MKTICLYFEIHQNIHLKRYRFFDIGTDHYYYDDYENERSISETSERSYIPALKTLIEMCRENKGFFKCAISLSGCTIELLEIHAPQVLELISELLDTGLFVRRYSATAALYIPMRLVAWYTKWASKAC